MKRAFNYLVIVISVAVLGVVLWSTSFFGVAKADVVSVANGDQSVYPFKYC